MWLAPSHGLGSWNEFIEGMTWYTSLYFFALDPVWPVTLCSCHSVFSPQWAKTNPPLIWFHLAFCHSNEKVIRTHKTKLGTDSTYIAFHAVGRSKNLFLKVNQMRNSPIPQENPTAPNPCGRKKYHHMSKDAGTKVYFDGTRKNSPAVSGQEYILATGNPG